MPGEPTSLRFSSDHGELRESTVPGHGGEAAPACRPHPSTPTFQPHWPGHLGPPLTHRPRVPGPEGRAQPSLPPTRAVLPAGPNP